MGTWMKKIAAPEQLPDAGKHIPLEDIARLAEGTIEGSLREKLFFHLNRCPDCSSILQETLRDMASDAVHQSPSAGRWYRMKLYAVAASIIFAVFAGGGYYKYYLVRHGLVNASVALDDDFRDLLVEDSSLSFSGSRAARFADLLSRQGVQVKGLQKVVLSKAYAATKSSSFFHKKESLKIRIEGGIAYVEVVVEKREE